jgi:hypothetical protein
VVIGEDLDPVMDPTHDDLRGENIGHHPVIKSDMDLTVVFDIFVVRPQESFIHEVRISRDFMCSGTDGLRPDCFPMLGNSFDSLKIKDGGKGVAALPYH